MRSSVFSVDFFQHVSMQMKVLDFFGLSFRIPYSKKSVYFWLGILSRMFIGILVFVVPTATQVVYLIRLILSGNANIQEVSAITNLVLTECMTSSKLLDLRLRRDRLQDMVDQLTKKEFSCSSETLRIILLRNVKISRILFIGCFVSAALDVLLHVVVVPGLQGFKTLPLKMNFIFFDVNDPKYFKYICAYQILYKPCMISTFVVLQTLPWAAMSFTVSQLNYLIYNLENINENIRVTRVEKRCDKNEAFKQIMKSCILHHSAIKRFINTLQTVFGGQLFSSLILSTGIIGTTAMQFLSIESPLENITEVMWVFVYMATMILILYIDSFLGNTITRKGEHLATLVYSTPWPDVNLSMKKNVLIFLTSSQQPMIISAANLIPVSLETFTKVMNWTYKGFAVINQMK